MQFLSFVRLIPKAIKEIGFKQLIFIIAAQAFQLSGVMIIAYINHRPWECVFLLSGYIVGKHQFPSNMHAPTFFICTAITWVLFYFLSTGTPSFHMSYTAPCATGVLLAAALHIIEKKFGGGNKS